MTLDLTLLICNLVVAAATLGAVFQSVRDHERRICRLEKKEEEGTAQAARVWRLSGKFGQ